MHLLWPEEQVQEWELTFPNNSLNLPASLLLMHTIERFHAFDEAIKIITVLPDNQFGFWEELQKKYSFSISHTLVAGGPTRFLSVKNGLKEVDEKGMVAIHDGVRPLVTTDTIKRCFADAEKFGNAIPVISPSDSLRMITQQGNMPVNRQCLRIIQTPQVFDAKLIKKAYLQDYSPDFTDDATLLEKTGENIHLVEGNRENIKITNPEDLIIAEALFHSIF